jgi:hypothetical protein
VRRSAGGWRELLSLAFTEHFLECFEHGHLINRLSAGQCNARIGRGVVGGINGRFFPEGSAQALGEPDADVADLLG